MVQPMCGICGIVDFSVKNGVTPDLLKTMIKTLKHRGPDYQDTWIQGPVGLAHARLSIIDLSATGRQPMISSDGRFVIVINGEIYNYIEIRKKLELLGARFRGYSDTEVFLEAYSRWKDKSLLCLNGIFSFAIWDTVEKELIIARDRFGVKPLYYARLKNGLIFGSEIKAILASQRIKPEINVKALHEFSYFGVALGSNTMFSGIHKLEPGHCLRIGSEQEHVEAFWELSPGQIVKDDLEDATEKVRFLLEQAVKRQLVGDVPIGIFLSGGVDSSCLTAFAVKNYNGKIRTYTVEFDFQINDSELATARRVADYFGTEHHEIFIAGDNISRILERLIYHHDEPFSDAANIPLYLLCKELNGDPRVVLQGDGGDEVFAGYRRYTLLSQSKLWEALSLIKFLVSPVVFKSQTARRLRRLLDAFYQNELGLRMALLLTTDTLQSSFVDLISVNWRQKLLKSDPFSRYHCMAKRFSNCDEVQKMLLTDIKILLPDIFLEKVDKSTMAFGIESRVPFLDNDLTDYVFRLPTPMKIQRRRKKYILKRALRGIVPDDILSRPKTGFMVPYGSWLRGPLSKYSREVIMDACSGPEAVLNGKKVSRYLLDHQNGSTQQNGFILWKALNFALWQQHYIDH